MELTKEIYERVGKALIDALKEKSGSYIGDCVLDSYMVLEDESEINSLIKSLEGVINLQ